MESRERNPLSGFHRTQQSIQAKTMFLRIDKLPVELPASPEIDPVAAKNVQELLGGRFGEMSTLTNYTYQSFAMRGREKIRPFYSLIANIAAEDAVRSRSFPRPSIPV